MELSRSTYYFELSKTDVVYEKNKELMLEIKSIYNSSKKAYGVIRVYRKLREKGYCVNHKRVQRLMHCMELQGKHPKAKYHSYKGEVGKVADNLIKRDFHAAAPLQKWSTDVSQFNFSWGKCYLSPILDMYSNEIISYDLSLHPDLKQIERMLYKAFEKHPVLDGLIFHSDQGWQYQHVRYRQSLKEHGITQSMSRKGNCYDNCIMESFFGRMKNEMYYGQETEYESFESFKKAVDDYIDFYNNERIQKKTKWMPPVLYREASTKVA